MISKQVRIKQTQVDYVNDHAIALAKLVRGALDDTIGGEHEYPTGRTRRDQQTEYKRTSIPIEDEHQEFIAATDLNFAQFVDDVIEDRIELERRVNEMETGP